MTHELIRERLETTLAFSLGFGAAVLLVAPLAGAFALVAVGWAFAMITLLGFLAGGLVIVFAWLSALQDVRWAIVESIASELDDQAARREALQSANVVQTNINTGSGSIRPKLHAPRVTLLGKQVSWSQLNQIAQGAPEPRRVELPREDVLWMLEQFIQAGHSRRTFAGVELPYSRFPAYPDAYHALIGDLVDGGAIEGRGERAAGRLVVKEIGELAKIVDVAHPRGFVLELPAQGSG